MAPLDQLEKCRKPDYRHLGGGSRRCDEMSFLLHTSGSVGAPGEQSPGATRPTSSRRSLVRRQIRTLVQGGVAWSTGYGHGSVPGMVREIMALNSLSDHVYPWQPPWAPATSWRSPTAHRFGFTSTLASAGDGGLAPQCCRPSSRRPTRPSRRGGRFPAAWCRPPCRSRKVASTRSPSSVCSVSSPRRLPCRTQFRSMKPRHRHPAP